MRAIAATAELNAYEKGLYHVSKQPSYASALRFVRSGHRIKLSELANEFSVSWVVAIGWLDRMTNEGVISREVDFIGYRKVLTVSNSDSSNSNFNGTEGQHQRHTSTKPLSEREQIAELEEKIARLKEAGKLIIQQREEWKSRALIAEAKYSNENTVNPKNDTKYISLKRIIAREIHPDYAQSEGLERILREALFKRIWPLIEDIEKNKN